MKNILGKTENLKLYNKEGIRVYEFSACTDRYYFEFTYDENGKVLTYKNSEGVERGFEIPEFTMEEVSQKLKKIDIVKRYLKVSIQRLLNK